MIASHVLVTGGAGFVGSHLCEALLREGARVTVVDDLCTGSEANLALLADVAPSPESFAFVERDVVEGLDDLDDLPALRGRRVDTVLHLACPASPLDYLRLPIETLRTGAEGTRHVLDLARRHGSRVVVASTSEVYGDPLVHPQTEEYWGNVNPIGPRSVYDEAKRYAEALTAGYRRAYGLDTGIVRLFNTYGPRMRTDDGRAVPAFVTQALRGEPLTVAGDGSQTRSLCYVDDTVAGILAMARSGEAGPINLGNPHEVSMRDLALEVIELSGSASQLVHVERPVDDPQLRQPDIAKAQRLLGWAPSVPRAEGLRRTIDWFAAAGIAAAAGPSLQADDSPIGL
jgi:dTDP-glucose 4,6-dehydratase